MQPKKTVKLYDEQYAIKGWGEHKAETGLRQWFKENVYLRNPYSFVLYKWLGKSTSSNITLFDAGCGNGNRSALLAKQGFNVIGGDISSVSIKQAKKRYSKYPNLEFLKCDLHSVPFKANTFDYIVCFDVMEHVSKPDKVLSELNRILKPRGNVIIEYETTENESRILETAKSLKVTFLKGEDMKQLFSKYFVIKKHFYNGQLRISIKFEKLIDKICATPVRPLFFFGETLIALIFGRKIKGISLFLLGEKNRDIS